MVDVARLGIAVDSSQVEKGTATLHQLTGAAGQASAAAQRLAGATNVEAAGHKAAAAAAQAHNAALMAQNTVIRSSMQQRTMMIYQLNDVAVSLASGMNPAMVAMQQGSQILQGGLAPALKTITDLVGGLVTKFWPLGVAVGAVTGLVAGLTYEINKTAETQVSMIDVALAAWGMFADQIGALVGPVWAWLVDGLQWVWDQMSPILKDMGNGIIRPFAFGVEAIGILWQKLPAAIGDAMITTANVIIKGIEWSINGATRLLNGFLEKYNEGLTAMGQKTIPLASGISIPQAANPYQGALGQLGQGLEAANLNANTTDFMGDMFGGLHERAQQIALARAATDELGGSAKAANDNFKKLADDGLGKVFDVTKELASAFHGLGKGIFDAFKKGGDVVGSVLDLIMGKLEQFATSWLDNIVNNGLDALFGSFGGFGMGSGMGGVSSITGSSGGFFPAFANGTNSAPGGLSWVGEQGPELVNLPRGSQVFDHNRSMGMAANQNRPISVQTNIINNAGVEVVENTVDDGQGGVRQEIILNRAVAQQIAKPGAANSAVRGVGRITRR